MADPIKTENLVSSSKTIKTFITEMERAMYAVPGVSKPTVERYFKSVGDSFQKFSKLPHTLAALSTFLHYNIAAIAYRHGSSPQAFISTFTASPELVAAILKMSDSNGKVHRNVTISRNIFNPRSEQAKMITLFDMEARKLVNFAATEWMILPPPSGFLPLDSKIADILHEALASIYDPNRKKERRKISGPLT